MKTCGSTSFKQALAVFIAGVLWLAATVSGLDYPQLRQKPEERKETEKQKAMPQPSLLDKAVNEDEYIIGPGDVFAVHLYGLGDEPLQAPVLPEGVLAIPKVGVVQLGQISLREAKQRIRDAIRDRVRIPQVDVQLAQVRQFKISVTGAVELPGLVVVSATDRVSEALKLAGGLQRKASQRNIRLMKYTDTTNVDMAMFHATGAVDRNPYLNEGHVIFVPVVSDSFDKIEVYGAVNAPGVFEYRPGDRLSDLIALGFGLSVDADVDDGELVRFDALGERKSALHINLHHAIEEPSSPVNLELQPDDRLFVRALAGYRRKEQVRISGEVKYPGTYPIQPGCETLLQLIEKAGGVLSNASLSEAEMYREARFFQQEKTSFDKLLQLETDKLSDFELQYLKEISSERTGKVAIDFERLLTQGHRELDVGLVDGDLIRIPAKSFSVTVMGRVVNPGLVPYREDAFVDYYIQAAGGYGYRADRGDIRIIKANTGAVVKAGNRTRVAMGDRIMVPQKKGINFWAAVKDVGLFLANVATIYIVVDQAVN